ncbi:MAG: hypothetical protein IPP96_15885 [Chitinophagaceae bacterium]|nr:hypothetical protein [Chitinophagaceae bacterium]
MQVSVRNGEITMGHARALINVIWWISSSMFLMKTKRGLSVRQTEDLVRK